MAVIIFANFAAYLPWLYGCLCVFACPPREHSSFSLYLSSFSMHRAVTFLARYHSISILRWSLLRTTTIHSPLTETQLAYERFAREQRGSPLTIEIFYLPDRSRSVSGGKLLCCSYRVIDAMRVSMPSPYSPRFFRSFIWYAFSRGLVVILADRSRLVCRLFRVTV